MSLFAPYLIINFDQAYLNIHSAIGLAHLSLVEFMLSIQSQAILLCDNKATQVDTQVDTYGLQAWPLTC